jgi:streptogramin lyase
MWSRDAFGLVVGVWAVAAVAATGRALGDCQPDVSPAFGVGINPFSLAMDAEGNTYVYDYLNGVRKYSPSGAEVLLCCEVSISLRYAVAIDPDGSILIAATDFSPGGFVHRYSSTGTFETSWRTAGAPEGLAVDEDGNVYVAEPGQDAIEKFTRSGSFLARWEGFSGPHSIAVADGFAYVNDDDGLTQLTTDGQPLRTYFSAPILAAAGGCWFRMELSTALRTEIVGTRHSGEEACRVDIGDLFAARSFIAARPCSNGPLSGAEVGVSMVDGLRTFGLCSKVGVEAAPWSFVKSRYRDPVR